MNQNKKKILFICTHNASRSQMAEGLLRTLYGERYETFSAGTQPTQVNPFAIKVMEEIGIDISTHRAKSVEEFRGMQFDLVVTVCDQAKETCPFFPGAKKYLHQSFEDPSRATGTDEMKLVLFRNVREKIKDWIVKNFDE